jgi:galactokinase
MQAIINTFREKFGKEPMIVAAPGRVNLIGEHTDYNEGFVLPGAVNKKMIIALVANGSRQVNLFANQYNQTHSFSLDTIKPEKDHNWHAYLRGVAYFMQQKGIRIEGVDVLIDGDVPVGAGMSSSAALCCGFAFGLNEIFKGGLSRLDIVYIAQKTEHVFAGAMVGVMDQFASLHGKAGHVIKLDCRSMEYEYIPFNFPEYRIVLVNSMVEHSLASSEYNIRRKQCEEGVAVMKKFLGEHIKSLRDVPLKELMAHKQDMGEEVYRRCAYVIRESERLLRGCELLSKGDLEGFGKLMYETHEGLSKEYNVSCPELDFLVEQAKTFPEIAGARMMGGGFGGCTINLIEESAVNRFTEFVQGKYQERFNKVPEVYTMIFEDGVKVVH